MHLGGLGGGGLGGEGGLGGGGLGSGGELGGGLHAHDTSHTLTGTCLQSIPSI